MYTYTGRNRKMTKEYEQRNMNRKIYKKKEFKKRNPNNQ